MADTTAADEARKKRNGWKVMAAVLPVHVALAALTWRDLAARDDGEVRGSKRVWRAWSLLNTLGSIAYWSFGRKPRSEVMTLGDVRIHQEFAPR
ncbi:MAG TPA: hypothetical protein VL961_03205 [Acidimicrobiales bacterium]|nr:hypothetical protein [Acidimicrobiales bacterium]